MVKKEVIFVDVGVLSGGKSKLKLILLIVVGLLLVIGLLVGGIWFFFSKLLKVEKIEEVVSEVVKLGKQLVFYEILVLVFVVNFNQNGWQCYMQVGVVLMGCDKVQMDVLCEYMLLVCNKLVMLFLSQSFDLLVILVGKEMFCQQVIVGLQELVKKEIG